MKSLLSGKVTHIFLLVIIINALFSSWWLLNNDFSVNFDISRDLILWFDIIHNNHITLIGGHSGTVPGLFHGPLWYYLNLPALIIGSENPIILGWFWIGLSVLMLVIIYFSAFKLFDKNIAILSTLLYSANSISNFIDDEKYFYNPYGAVLLSPIFFILFFKYINSLHVIYLAASVFVVGLMVQFQMAFGIPLLILLFLYSVYFLYRSKRLMHLLTFAIILIPLSTFIIFEFKNSFMQSKTVINYISQPKDDIELVSFLSSRIDQMVFDNFRMLANQNTILVWFLGVTFFGLLIYQLVRGHSKFISLFAYFYFGFGIITLAFRGEVVNYYWPFLPVMIIVYCYLLVQNLKLSGLFIILVISGLNMFWGINDITNYSNQGEDFSAWNYNLRMASNVYSDAGQEFGYFIYTPDLFGYGQRYAMEYSGKKFSDVLAVPFEKRAITYLIIANEDPSKKTEGSEKWKSTDVKISSDPQKVYEFKNYRIEKYYLSKEEIATPANPSLLLLNSGYFR